MLQKKWITFLLAAVLFAGCQTTTTQSTTTDSQTEDTGTPQQNSAPVFESATMSFTINEGELFEENVTASDADNDTITYTLLGADAASFDLNGSTIRAKNPFDYETKNIYSIELRADDTQAQTTTEITIHVNNVVETPPVLNPLHLSIAENVAVGTLVGNVDINSSGDGIISGYILEDNSSTFEVSSDGNIYTRFAIDYESRSFYPLKISALNEAGESAQVDCNITVEDIYEVVKKRIPTVVIVMNWNDYFENDPQVWYDKIFNFQTRSVNRWYDEVTNGEIEFVPIAETSGTAGDGVIMVNMGKNHPGDFNDTLFRDTEITNAVSASEVVNSFDFASLDTDGNGVLNTQEIQFIFIVAGGESSYSDNPAHSIWAHAWSYGSLSGPVIDGVRVMAYNSDGTKYGTYARFGATHGIDDPATLRHKATIGVMVHELGHSLLHLDDYYDNESPTAASGGSGLGAYDVMSGGAWMQTYADSYSGETPTQFSVYNKIDAAFDVNLTEITQTQTVTIGCDSRELIKLPTSSVTEYFLLECRDTAKINSDASFNTADSRFTDNTLFTVAYHVDDTKTNNWEDGVQTAAHHYRVAVVEKDETTLLTNTLNLRANYDDVYLVGDVIANTQLKLYDATPTTYSVEVVDANYTSRTMTLKITR